MEGLRREMDELDANSNRFARSFKLQRGELPCKQDQKRAGFEKKWQRKTAREADIELAQLRRAIEHWERDFAEAKTSAAVELGHTRNSDRVAPIHLQGRPVASPPKTKRQL
jgi:hypothetical protein